MGFMYLQQLFSLVTLVVSVYEVYTNSFKSNTSDKLCKETSDLHKFTRPSDF